MIQEFDEQFLRDIVKGKSRGDFPPYSSGNWKEVDNYLKQIVGRINGIPSLIVNADFNHYGSGFSSYVPIQLSHRNRSDVTVSDRYGYKTEDVNGLLLYLCRMAPYAVYAEGYWKNTFQGDKWYCSGCNYIAPEDVGSTPNTDWHNELIDIKDILNQYGITILTPEELDRLLDFEIEIRTFLAEPPYTVFDCFFYWED